MWDTCGKYVEKAQGNHSNPSYVFLGYIKPRALMYVGKNIVTASNKKKDIHICEHIILL